MATAINTKIMSLNAQCQGGRTTGNIAQAMERWSSGPQINRAKDDAAGLWASPTRSTLGYLPRGSKNSSEGP